MPINLPIEHQAIPQGTHVIQQIASELPRRSLFGAIRLLRMRSSFNV